MSLKKRNAKKPAAKRPVAKQPMVAPFASLMGIRAENDTEETQDEREARWAALAEDDPDREQAEDESDDDYATRMEEMDDEESEGDDKPAASDDEPSADDGEPEDDKGKDKDAKAARASERARCARIIAHGVKTGCVNQAAVLAFDTTLSASSAIATMKAANIDAPKGQNAGSGLDGRMNNVNQVNLGTNPPSAAKPNTPEGKAAGILDAMRMVNPTRYGDKK